MQRVKQIGFAVALVTAWLAGCLTAHAMASGVTFEIAAGSAPTTLKIFAAQAHLQLLFDYKAVRSLKTPAVRGQLEPGEALKLLLQGSGLTFRQVNDHTIAVIAVGPDPTTSRTVPADKSSTNGTDKELKESSSDGSRVAQADQGPVSNPPEKSAQTSEKRPVWLEEVIVTGSRIPTHAKDGAQDVKVYTREKIEHSGQTTVTDFLNTLPDASVALADTGFQSFAGTTTVQLHGLPFGTTLVLLNGRRLEASGAAQTYFDLNSIPLAAVERIEVVSVGSSAIYGADATAGVVNIILKKDFNGLEAGTSYSRASGTHDTNASLAWGKRWSRGSASLIGSYQTRSELEGFGRAITATEDHTASGGTDQRVPSCNPGSVFSMDGNPLPGLGQATFAAVTAGFTGTPTQQEFLATAGTLNECSSLGYYSIIPGTRREGILASGNYDLTSKVQMFTELTFSRVRTFSYSPPPSLFAVPGFSQFTVSASNPYNPFGETVGIGYLFTSLGREETIGDAVFSRVLLGARGQFFDRWEWEVSAWDSQDRFELSPPGNQIGSSVATQNILNALNSSNPSTALNPFVDGAAGSPQLLASLLTPLPLQKFYGKLHTVNGFVRGAILQLPSGPIELVLGGEYDRNSLDASRPPAAAQSYYRSNHALFGEARVPILAHGGDSQAGDVLAATLAGRYDSYSDFGSKATPQFGAEWRPAAALLIRGTYGQAFKTPALPIEHLPVQTFQNYSVVDPLLGNQTERVTLVTGGNTNLLPETGQSRTLGLVYSSKAIPGLEVLVTNWRLDNDKSVQFLSAQAIINNEILFPNNVIRAPGQNGQPGPITRVDSRALNFGKTSVAGIDYQIDYKYQTRFGRFIPSLSATDTYHYTTAVQPGVPATDRLSIATDDGNFSPRWKGTAALGWELGPYGANAGGRYVGRYQDYDNTAQIGNFWLYDANFSYALGKVVAPSNERLQGAHIELGGVNIFNRLPQYSNFGGGYFGYDPAESDIRGRFLYLKLGAKW